ncbi:hypothetical protein DS745_13385 [Anaerobacillus alkaliphilus]|uniref:PucR C-terminal helix-turn-helix domain-containing protein n=1 Tax=Anaerobacillus alkaliphilus TaxID=1548597 RepID=A0A4Q0VU90_9BACI|nr:helix-turn-helix domain-containing protein [Anaerobacillus alkaliphilus]RXI99867.1 hypothetical protein DS745_13385 [Anaerobacillus alkaliphilus]
MVEHLRVILKKAVIEEEEVRQLPQEQLLQYKTTDEEVLYLNKDHLMKEEIQLLDLFLTAIHTTSNAETNEQQYWKELTISGRVTSSPPLLNRSAFRFSHFIIDGELHDEINFIEALHSLFPRKITVVLVTRTEGFVVEYMTDEDEEHVGESLIEAIMSDFYVKIAFFQGSMFTNVEEAKSIYDWEKNAFSLARRVLPNLSFVQKEQLIPFLLSSDTSEMTINMLLQIIDFLRDDKELLKTIKVFMESNLNTTLAAKKLFMHRNSLQYRIDKFIEKTGIDIKQFQQAASLYFLISLDESMKHQLK